MPTDYREIEEGFVISDKRSNVEDDEGNTETPRPSKSRRFSMKQQCARDGSDKGKADTFDKCRPDLVLVDHSIQEPREDWCLWRHFAVPLEVKRE